ncbi:MAG: hypothetical protein WB869_10050 [Candidatus Acidiferrales bacterium]
MDNTEQLGNESPSRMPAFLIGVVLVALLGAALVWMVRHSSAGGGTAVAEAHLPFGPAEQKAAERIHFHDIALSEATNMLNQNFTYVNGVVSDDGADTVKEVEVTIEFRNSMDQVGLRETRKLLGPGAAPLLGGDHRDFSVTLEAVPSDWNHEYPSIRVTGLRLQ